MVDYFVFCWCVFGCHCFAVSDRDSICSRSCCILVKSGLMTCRSLSISAFRSRMILVRSLSSCLSSS